MYLSRRILKFLLVKLPKYTFSIFFVISINLSFVYLLCYLLYDTKILSVGDISKCHIVYPYFVISNILIFLIHIGYVVDSIFDILEFNYKRKYSLYDEI